MSGIGDPGGAAGGAAAALGVEERFGPYGGRFVPEVLISPLDELTAAWAKARDDPSFRAELDRLLRDYVGRPTPLYEADRLSERVGRRVLLKREDLAHTGAHKINNAVGQALLARRMGKARVIAETGAGQHGVAAATACALLGLECVVYMGTEDMRRQAPNVERMSLLGAEVAPVEAGARTLKEAVSAAIRDWVANAASTHYVIGSAVGPAPYPALVRDLQRVIGDETREQALVAEGALPARVIACVGGGSNAIGTFCAFLDDPVELIGVEAGGEGLQGGRHGASLVAGRTGALHGAVLGVLGVARRRRGPDPRGALGLRGSRLPGRRTRARPPTGHRPGPLRGGDRRRSPGCLPRSGAIGGHRSRARARPRDRLAPA
jgi:tryptophan synthase beta chain